MLEKHGFRIKNQLGKTLEARLTSLLLTLTEIVKVASSLTSLIATDGLKIKASRFIVVAERSGNKPWAVLVESGDPKPTLLLPNAGDGTQFRAVFGFEGRFKVKPFPEIDYLPGPHNWRTEQQPAAVGGTTT